MKSVTTGGANDERSRKARPDGAQAHGAFGRQSCAASSIGARVKAGATLRWLRCALAQQTTPVAAATPSGAVASRQRDSATVPQVGPAAVRVRRCVPNYRFCRIPALPSGPARSHSQIEVFAIGRAGVIEPANIREHLALVDCRTPART